jgi:hypothetical protein
VPWIVLTLTRRVRCPVGNTTVTEPDAAGGRRRRTTGRGRETMGRQAAIQPVAETVGVGPRCACDGFKHLTRPGWESRGRDVQAQLSGKRRVCWTKRTAVCDHAR